MIEEILEGKKMSSVSLNMENPQNAHLGLRYVRLML